ncbi:MAG: hypothetical protein A2X49_01505 [Lentisphaerae bacterium GWF2_52_8]|nr:MAG: hypothetical protein A2X49_01505 [Lentisphaerae bacterium GWF2_52_8]
MQSKKTMTSSEEAMKASTISAATTLLKTQYPKLNEAKLQEALVVVGDHEGNQDRGAVRLMRVNEFCKACAISRPTFFRWIKAGQIKPMRLGGVLRVPEAELNRLAKVGGAL